MRYVTPVAVALLDIALRAEGAARRRSARAHGRRLAQQATALKLHCGCGYNLLPGWVNIDLRSQAHHVLRGRRLTLRERPDVYADLGETLPFPDASASHVYSSNFVEHLSREEALRHFREAHRVLRSGGRIRVVVPDVGAFARAYAERDEVLFERAVSPLWPTWSRLPMDFLMTIAHGDEANGWVHRWGWDEETLTVALNGCGFAETRRYEINASDDPDLRDLDGDLDIALSVEGVRP